MLRDRPTAFVPHGLRKVKKGQVRLSLSNAERDAQRQGLEPMVRAGEEGLRGRVKLHEHGLLFAKVPSPNQAYSTNINN